MYDVKSFKICTRQTAVQKEFPLEALAVKKLSTLRELTNDTNQEILSERGLAYNHCTLQS